MLARCQRQFTFYEGQHRAKGTPESDHKAEVNRIYARDCADQIEFLTAAAADASPPTSEVPSAWRPIETARVAFPIDQYHEDFGPVLWWTWPVSEPPYSGTPDDSDWPGYHTHWSPIVAPVREAVALPEGRYPPLPATPALTDGGEAVTASEHRNSTQPSPAPSPDLREEVARLVDEWAWQGLQSVGEKRDIRDRDALELADAIHALYTRTGRGE